MYTGPDYIAESVVEDIIKQAAIDLNSDAAAQEIPYAVLLKILSHKDSTHFITEVNPIIVLSEIMGAYTVSLENGEFLYRMNLHSGAFGETLLEQEYISQLPKYSCLYVSYINSSDALRNIQLIKG